MIHEESEFRQTVYFFKVDFTSNGKSIYFESDRLFLTDIFFINFKSHLLFSLLYIGNLRKCPYKITFILFVIELKALLSLGLFKCQIYCKGHSASTTCYIKVRNTKNRVKRYFIISVGLN